MHLSKGERKKILHVERVPVEGMQLVPGVAAPLEVLHNVPDILLVAAPLTRLSPLLTTHCS